MNLPRYILKIKKRSKILLSFDLDFTLIDNSGGIVNSFQYAVKKHDLPLLDDKAIENKIGEPLEQIFADLYPDSPIKTLVSSFREYYKKEGIYQVKLLSGVLEKIKELYQNFPLGIITSKKEEMAKKLIKHLNLRKYFEFILGETEERILKTDPKIEAYLRLKYPGFTYIIIGDHPKDKELAQMLGSPFVGVLTGNHNKEELEQDIKVPHQIIKNLTDLYEDLIFRLVKKESK